MAKTNWIMLWVLRAAGLLFVGTAHTAPILDQAFANVTCSGCTSGLSQTLDGFFPFSGQTVTAGVTGNLTSVSIFASQNSSLTLPWIADIVAAPGGVPDGNVLAVSNPFVLPIDEFVWTSIPLPSSPFMSAGTSFAIVMQLQGVTQLPISGTWGGGILATDPYTGGQPVAGFALNSLLPQGNFPGLGQGALFFQTFVAPVPEPSTFILVLTALGLAARAATRQRYQVRKLDSVQVSNPIS